jgi:hypothetical protein
MGVCNLGVLTRLLLSFGLQINSVKTSVKYLCARSLKRRRKNTGRSVEHFKKISSESSLFTEPIQKVGQDRSSVNKTSKPSYQTAGAAAHLVGRSPTAPPSQATTWPAGRSRSPARGICMTVTRHGTSGARSGSAGTSGRGRAPVPSERRPSSMRARPPRATDDVSPIFAVGSTGCSTVKLSRSGSPPLSLPRTAKSSTRGGAHVRDCTCRQRHDPM